MCEFHSETIAPFIPNLINTLVECLKDEPRIANNACWAVSAFKVITLRHLIILQLHFICEAHSDPEENTSPISMFYTPILNVCVSFFSIPIFKY